MAEADPQLHVEAPAQARAATAGLAPAGARPPRRRARLARGPVTIGEPAAPVHPLLAAAEPYRPDTVADGGDAFGLTVRAASVRGLYKRHLGGPRQDDLCLRAHPPSRSVIAAVADGVSAAARSDLAAALAVRHAVASVERQLEGGAADIEWPSVFHHAAWALVEEQRRAGGDGRAGIDATAASLATTLTVAVIGPADQPEANGCDADDVPDTSSEQDAAEEDPVRYRVQVAGVGDSPAYHLAHRRFELVLGDAPSVDGLIGGGTRALPRDVRAIAESACMLGSGSALLVCTDGLALPLADGTGDVGQALARELTHPPDIVDFARLLDFSRATYDDDRTLIAVWPAHRR